MSELILSDHTSNCLLATSPGIWLTRDALACRRVEVMHGLDLTRLIRQYAGHDSRTKRPSTLPCVLARRDSKGVIPAMGRCEAFVLRCIAICTLADRDTPAILRRRLLEDLRAGLRALGKWPNG